MLKNALVVTAITLGFAAPATAGKIYIGNNCTGVISELNTTTNAVDRDFQARPRMIALAASPTEKYIFAATQLTNSTMNCPDYGYSQPSMIEVVNTLSGNVVRYWTGSSPVYSFRGLATSKDGNWLYAASVPLDQQFIQQDGGTILVFNTQDTNLFASEVRKITGLALGLNGIASDYIGGVNKLFVSSYDAQSQALYILDGDTGATRNVINFGLATVVRALTMANGKVYVLTGDTRVIVVDTTTESIVGTLDFSAVPSISAMGSHLTVEGNTLAVDVVMANGVSQLVLRDLVTNVDRVVPRSESYPYLSGGPVIGDYSGGFYTLNHWWANPYGFASYVYHVNGPSGAYDAVVTPGVNGFSTPFVAVKEPGGTCTSK